CGTLGEEEASAARDLEALVDELVLIGVGEEAEIDARAPDGVAVVIAVELAVAKGGCKDVGLHSAAPELRRAGDCYGEAAVAPEAAEGLGAVVVGRADEGDLTVAVGVGPAGRRRIVQRRLVGGLDFDDVARASGGVVEDVLIALDDVEIVVRDVLHVETPAGIAAGAE